MAAPRSDLEGARLKAPGSQEHWLILHGERRLVANAAVASALFGSHNGVVPADDLESIARGPDLNDGTCLVRSEVGGTVYLVTGFPATETRRHPIAAFEVFLGFGFDDAAVLRVPPLVLAAIPTGRAIMSVKAASDAKFGD